MSLLTDLRAVSENAVEQIAARFSDLPRPLLAAIGAGEMAVERLAELRESLTDAIGERVSAPSMDVTDVRSAVTDLPSRAQKVAAEVAGSIEHFAAGAPGRAQDLMAQLPERFAEFQTVAQSLSPDAVKGTLEAYSQLAGMIYGSLADRGDKTWSKVRATGLQPGIVVDAVAAKVRPARAAAGEAAKTAASAAVKASAVRRAKADPTPTRVATPRPRKAPAAAHQTTPTPGAAARTAASEVTAPAAPRPGAPAPKSAAKPTTPTSAAKPSTPRSSAKPATPRSTATPVTPKPAGG